MNTSLPSLELIPSFTAVMRYGSLSAAARHLSVAQPTVRRHVETLEAELGATLFTRAPNGLTPTEVAQSLLPHALAVLDQAAALRRAAAGSGEAVKGSVRLTASRVAAVHLLPSVLAGMDAPGLTVELVATDTSENLLNRAADIALRFAVPTQGALVVQKLPSVKLGLFARDAVQDMTRTPFIADDRANEVLPALAAAGVPAPHEVVLRSDDALVQCAAIAAGMGVGVCQCGIAARMGFVRVMPDIEVEMPAYLVMHEDLSRVARVRFVFDYLKRALPAVL